jgi:hypothetical protein
MNRIQHVSNLISSRLAMVLFCVAFVSATEYHVATNGQDTNPGTSGSPFKTITKAASVMQAGDICTVHAGTYREWVKPPRSGTSNTQRIVYQAATGETVKIKGSEQITTWVNQGGNLWKADLPNTFFGTYNPYSLNIDWTESSTSYIGAGQWHHRGDVYLNETALYEKQTQAEVQNAANSWYCSVSGATTSIYANFGSTNPNTALAEINVRQSVFWPDQLGTAYITVDGFTIMHSAESWSGASGGNGLPQWGAIGPRWGLSWIIQNCRVKNARVIGICIGNEHGSDANFATFGHHIIRNNWISNCGQAGIAGERGCAGSTIDNNLIEDIDDRQEFGGWEGGGIKLHFVVDVTITNNCIRRVKATSGMAGHAMWLDWTCQNSRVSGNLMYAIENGLLNLEVFQGPVLFSNNVFIGDICNHADPWSSNVCFVNNLFYNVSINWGGSSGRTSPWFTAHSLNRAGSGVPSCDGQRVYNNLFIGGGSGAYNGTNTFVDYNVYLQGASKTNDAHGVTDSYNTGFAKQEVNGQVIASFNLNATPFSVACPQPTSSWLGTFQPANVSFTNPDNSPMTMNRDYYENTIPVTGVKPGPFQDIKQGANQYVLWPRNGGATPVASHFDSDRRIPDEQIVAGTAVLNHASVMRIVDLRGQIVFKQGTGGQTAAHLRSGTYIAVLNHQGNCVARTILHQPN